MSKIQYEVTKTEYCDPELEIWINRLIQGKATVSNKEYQKCLKRLWKEFKDICQEDTKIIKSRDKIMEELNSW